MLKYLMAKVSNSEDEAIGKQFKIVKINLNLILI